MPGVVAAAATVYAAWSYVQWLGGMAATARKAWNAFRSARLEHSLRGFHATGPHKMCALEKRQQEDPNSVLE